MDLYLLLVSSFLCGLLVLDNLQFAQVSLSRPSLVGLLIGWLVGSPIEGASLGLGIELCYSTFLPLGGNVPPNGAVAGTISALVFAFAGRYYPFAFFAGFFSGFLYAGLDVKLRQIRGEWSKIVENEVSDGKIRLNFWMAKSLMQENISAVGFVLFFSVFFFALAVFLRFAFFRDILRMAHFMVLWAALSAILHKFAGYVKNDRYKK